MQYDDRFIQAYIQDSPLSRQVMYPYFDHFHKPDVKRKDVVEELNKQLANILDEFPVFNKRIWNAIFPNKDDFLDSITICPIVGSDSLSKRIVIENQTYILLDLICIANYTRILSQMVYVIKNHITFEITKLCILEDYPLRSNNYQNILNVSAFINGFAHYVAWNESCEFYKFYTDKYEVYKEKAFGLLAQSMVEDNIQMQQKILKHISSSDLWEQFPAVAGMFYIDDIYRELGVHGLQQLYRLGPKEFIQHIFE